jgi:methylmalonyl-CoA epimerase
MTTISRIDHIAIAVHSIEEASQFYIKGLGLTIAKLEEMPERGIRTAFIIIGESMIELIEPLDKNQNSEISKFLAERGPGLHHIAFKTKDINTSMQQLKHQGARLVYDKAQKGAHDTIVNFVHPRSTNGVLVELVE